AWWRRNVGPLSRRLDVRVIDLLALERPFQLSRTPDRLVAWMDAQAMPRVTLVGHSMGGAIALDVAARWPERVGRLVVIGAPVRRVAASPRVRGVLAAGWLEPLSLA